MATAEPARDQAQRCQDDDEIGHAQPDGQRRIGRDVLEEMALRGDRREPGDRKLLEEHCGREQDIDPEDRMRENEDECDGKGENGDEQKVAPRRDDRTGAAHRESQRGETQREARASSPRRVDIARRPGADETGRRAHRTKRRSANWAMTTAAASPNAARELPGMMTPAAPRTAQTTKRVTARPV